MTVATCSICGEPMPATEQMFKYHGYSGPCPRPPLAERTAPAWQPTTLRYETVGDAMRVSMSEADFNELRRLAAVAPAGMDGWQPIETAPKDGRELLLATQNGIRPYVGKFSQYDLAWCEPSGLIRLPTHWQPLPTPPATAGQEES